MPRASLPFLKQLDGYDGHRARSDLSAGITVGVMLIPQGMAYALIAGLPPIYGLYASLVPLVVYALLGTSRHLAVGPVAIVSLLVAAGVAPLADGDPERYIELSLLLALMVGVLQLVMGLLRFGFLTNFLSHPVLSGFTSAAALIIGASQLRHLVGVDLPRGHEVHLILWELGQSVAAIHLPTLMMGLVGIGLLVGLGRLSQAIPGALVVVVLATAASWLLGFEDRGMSVVSQVPGGLPLPVIPPLDPTAMWQLLPVALTIALVGFMESIAVAKVYATRHRYDIQPDQELVALGAANLVGAFFRAYPTTGGFSRTAVNSRAGATSTLASLVSAGVIALTLLFLTGLFYHLPNAILAAIVMVAVAGLVDVKEARHLWRADRSDLAMMGVTFVATLALGIEAGILVGVLVSLGALVYRTSRPHVALTGRLPGTHAYRSLKRHPEAETEPGVVILRIDATLCFANAQVLRDQIRALVDVPEGELPPHTIVLDFHPVNGVDSTVLHQLEELIHLLRARGVSLRFAGVKGPVMDRIRRVGLHQLVGPDRFHWEVEGAVTAAVSEGRGAARTRSASLEEGTGPHTDKPSPQGEEAVVPQDQSAPR